MCLKYFYYESKNQKHLGIVYFTKNSTSDSITCQEDQLFCARV